MTSEEVLQKELQDGILTLTINRPQALNCFNMPLLRVFGETVDDVALDKEVRVVIITGSTEGKNAFSTGADLKERAGMSPDEVRLFITTIRNLFTAVEELPKPVIAAVNGYAFGGGLELALACDIRLASDNAVVGLTETSLAIIPGAGGTQRLPRVVGVARAMEMILRARRIKARNRTLSRSSGTGSPLAQSQGDSRRNSRQRPCCFGPGKIRGQQGK
jgi:enoyl-CoA hydratase/carnithine racemase